MYEAILGSYKNLGLGILGQAARDWRVCEKSPKAKREIKRFLDSEYFEDLCDLIEIDSSRTKRAIIEKWGEKEKVDE